MASSSSYNTNRDTVRDLVGAYSNQPDSPPPALPVSPAWAASHRDSDQVDPFSDQQSAPAPTATGLGLTGHSNSINKTGGGGVFQIDSEEDDDEEPASFFQASQLPPRKESQLSANTPAASITHHPPPRTDSRPSGPNPLQNSNNATSNSYNSRSHSSGHLRQRSVTSNQHNHHPHRQDIVVIPLGTDRDEMENKNPFGDKFFGDPNYQPYQPHNEYMSDHGHTTENLAHATASNMRSDRAEWMPAEQHLYSTLAMNDDDAGRVLARHPPQSSQSHSSSSHSSQGGKRSQQRYNLAAISPEVLNGYSKSRYTKEVDDKLHDFGPRSKREGIDRRITEKGTKRMGSGTICTMRGCMNLGMLVLLVMALLMLFGGYPVYTYFAQHKLSNFGATGPGGINATGQVPNIPGFRGLIDADTPEDAMSRTGFDGKEYQLVFSDEFNTDGRTFYPGEDPYWEAVNLWYWQTVNIEWYDPDNIRTQNGYLQIDVTQETMANSHDRGYLGGMLQTWNKFCFQGGYIEASISLPGDTKHAGFWPAFWTMSNLGRAGYGGSLEGTWPYVYEACDVGTLANQTNPLTGQPVFTAAEGDQYNQDKLSFLPGQRLSACTCPGELHPGPKLANGSFVGRGAAEIDVFEATIGGSVGHISQSAQWAPFNPYYTYTNTSTDYVEFYDNDYNSKANTYLGGAYQQVTSGLSDTVASTYNQTDTTKFMKYGFEYQPSFFDGWGTGFVTFSQNAEPMWKIFDKAMGPNAKAQVSNRIITGEPMYILLNLGMSQSFGAFDIDDLTFPAHMRVDYVRVYQTKDQQRIGCDPKDHPTADYIAALPEAYNNPQITTFKDMGLSFPKNRLIDTC